MSLTQRILISKNGTITDLTTILNDHKKNDYTPAIISAEDAIYIGSIYPFNHKWIEVSTVNAAPANAIVQIWNDEKWEDAVDEIDYTAITGGTLFESGILQFRPHIDKGWSSESESNDVTDLTGTEIYNMYWIKITFTADLSAGMVLKYIGNRFSSDSDLFTYYPDLSNPGLMEAFEAGKTDWNDQHFAAADAIIQHLATKSIILDKSQILDWSLFKMAAIHKVAEIAYYGLGKNKAANIKAAQAQYKDAINVKYFNADKTNTGTLSKSERQSTTREMSR